MSLALKALLAGIAGYRLAGMLVEEAGPYDVFEKLRTKADREPVLRDLLNCFWCASVWTSTGCYLVGAFFSWVPIAVVASWGVATLAKAVEHEG